MKASKPHPPFPLRPITSHPFQILIHIHIFIPAQPISIMRNIYKHLGIDSYRFAPRAAALQVKATQTFWQQSASVVQMPFASRISDSSSLTDKWCHGGNLLVSFEHNFEGGVSPFSIMARGPANAEEKRRAKMA